MGFFPCGELGYVWDVHAQKLARRMSVLSWANRTDLSRGRRFASGGKQSGRTPVGVPQRSGIASLHGHKGRVLAVAFSPDSTTLATGGDDQSVRLWNVATGQEMLTLEGHTAPIVGLSFSKAGNMLISLAQTPSGSAPVELFCWIAR